jgi:hypothetical protein
MAIRRHGNGEAVLFLLIFVVIFGYLGYHMGLANLSGTIMKTAHDILLNTVFFIMAITVLTGALGKLMIEFGVVGLLEKILAPFMKPLFGLPGVAALGALVTFFSDNPAIIALADDKKFTGYFKEYQLVSLVNFGTAFGMGLIVITFMIGQGFVAPAFVGLAGAIVGGAISTRTMQTLIRNRMPAPVQPSAPAAVEVAESNPGTDEGPQRGDENLFLRILNAMLDGGKSGVELGLAIIPGVLIITTFVMMFVFGPSDPSVGYQGLAYEGVPLLRQLGETLSWFFHTLFGFDAPELIAFPMTSLGAVGAAISLVPAFVARGIVTGNDIAVLTAMGMCWSGFLSTHTAMLDALGFRKLTSRAIISHTFGGLGAGIFAHFAYVGLSMVFNW